MEHPSVYYVYMKNITLTNGGCSLVSDEDFDEVSKYKWYRKRGENKREDAVRTTDGVKMSRFIMNPPKDMVVDHADGNTLNNMRENLRICTQAENGRNSLIKTNTSGMRGVHWHKGAKKWVAKISVDYERKFLGYFDSLGDAGRAYNEAAKKYHGEFAKLNYIEK